MAEEKATQVIVKTRHTRVPDALKQSAVQKVGKVKRFFDRINKLEIEFSEEHNPRVSRKHVVEVTLSTKQHVLRAVGTGVDPASAVDAVVDKLETQVKRLKGKMTRRSKGAPPETIRIPVAPRANDRRRGSKADRVNSGPSSKLRIRRAGAFSVEPMTPEDAALALDATDEEFLPFVNAETSLISVVFRMDNGSFGLLEPAEM